MERWMEIERIVAGSLLADFDSRYPETRWCVGEAMFRDPQIRDVYRRMRELFRKGIPVNASTVYEAGDRSKEDMLLLHDLVADCDFTERKHTYELTCRLAGRIPRDASFADYVRQLIANNGKRNRQEERQRRG